MGRKAQVRFLGGWARATASGNPTDQADQMQAPPGQQCGKARNAGKVAPIMEFGQPMFIAVTATAAIPV